MSDQIRRAQLEVGGPVAPGCLDCEEYLSVRGEVEAIRRKRRSQEVAAELLAPVLALGSDGPTGVQIEAVASALVAAGEGPRCGVAKAKQALAGAGTGRSALLDAGGEEVGHRGRVVELGGAATLFVVLPVSSANEQAPHTLGDGVAERRDLVAGRSGQANEHRRMSSLRLPRGTHVDTIQHRGVEVQVELAAAAEALDHGESAGLDFGVCAYETEASRALPVEGAECAPVDTVHVQAEVVVEGQQEAQPVRDRECPVPHSDRGQHPVGQVGGDLGLAPGHAARADASVLAAEGDEPVGAAAAAAEAGEATREVAAAEQAMKRGHDVVGQRAVASLALGQECPQMPA